MSSSVSDSTVVKWKHIPALLYCCVRPCRMKSDPFSFFLFLLATVINKYKTKPPGSLAASQHPPRYPAPTIETIPTRCRDPFFDDNNIKHSSPLHLSRAAHPAACHLTLTPHYRCKIR